MPKTLSEELTLGQRLARARREAKMSQSALADAIGVSRQTISNYERGGTDEVQFEIVAKWAKATDVALEYFAAGVTGRYPFLHAVDGEGRADRRQIPGQGVMPFLAAVAPVLDLTAKPARWVNGASLPHSSAAVGA